MEFVRLFGMREARSSILPKRRDNGRVVEVTARRMLESISNTLIPQDNSQKVMGILRAEGRKSL